MLAQLQVYFQAISVTMHPLLCIVVFFNTSILSKKQNAYLINKVITGIYQMHSLWL